MSARRGRKPLPYVTVGKPMTLAGIKRLLVMMAAHSARLHYAGERKHGNRVTWKEAIERAIEETAYQRGPNGKRLPIFVDDDGVPLVTYGAVERQIFPRTRDRKKL